MSSVQGALEQGPQEPTPAPAARRHGRAAFAGAFAASFALFVATLLPILAPVLLGALLAAFAAPLRNEREMAAGASAPAAAREPELSLTARLKEVFGRTVLKRQP